MKIRIMFYGGLLAIILYSAMSMPAFVTIVGLLVITVVGGFKMLDAF